MKIFNVIALVLVTVFLFSAVCFFEASSAACDDDQQCDPNCNFACCGEALLPVVLIDSPCLAFNKALCFNQVLHQELFVFDIEYPPRNSKVVRQAIPSLNNV